MTNQRTVLITGGTTGIGAATVMALAAQGDRVIFTARKPSDGDQVAAKVVAQTGNNAVEHRRVDLASLASVRDFAAGINGELESVDVVINNAGVILRKRAETADGFEMTFGVNHLGHFAMIDSLSPLLKRSPGSRIVILSSDAHKFARKGLDFDDLQATQRYSFMSVYARSKLANLLFSRELSRRLADDQITVNAVHPGAVSTRLGRDGDGGRLAEYVYPVIGRFLKSPEEGAATSVWAATAPELATVTGEYFADSKRAKAATVGQDDAAARRLWEISEQLTAA